MCVCTQNIQICLIYEHYADQLILEGQSANPLKTRCLSQYVSGKGAPVGPSPLYPWVVIFKSLSFIHKKAILEVAQKHKALGWNFSPLFILQNYSSEAKWARKEFSSLFQTGKIRQICTTFYGPPPVI